MPPAASSRSAGFRFASVEHALARQAHRRPWRASGVSPFNVPAKVTRTFAMRIPNEVERIVIDTPAAINKHQYIEFTRDADRITVPGAAVGYRHSGGYPVHRGPAAAREDPAHREPDGGGREPRQTQHRDLPSLMRFLDALKIPVIAVLRDSQNYIRAADRVSACMK
jgi:chromosome partitioning protein